MGNREIIISIIIPAYNCEGTIKEAISSVINQGVKEIEVIVINDGSTDTTKKIVENEAKKDSRVIIINQQNQGVSSARNRGIEMAKGKFISFLDADDIFETNGLKKLLIIAAENDVELVVGALNVSFIARSGRESQKIKGSKHAYEKIDSAKGFEILYVNDLVGTAGAKLYKREFLINYNLKFPTFNNGEDRLFVINCFYNIRTVSIINTPVYKYYYKRHGAACRYNINKFLSMEAYYFELVKFKEKNPLISIKANDFLLRGAISAMCSCMHESCDLTSSEIKAYFFDIKNNKSVKFATQNYETNNLVNIVIKICVSMSTWPIGKFTIYVLYLFNSYFPGVFNGLRDKLNTNNFL